MKRLTLSEELNLIQKAYHNDNFIGHGSSRAVYDLEDGTVLKVATCIRGQRQNGIEIDTYRYASEERRDHLAKIYAYGKYVVLMEKIQVIDFDLIEDIYDYGTDYDSMEEEHERRGWELSLSDGEAFVLQNTDEVFEHVNLLNMLLGETSDNCQLGLDKDKKIKSYDYGYEVGYHSESVSDDLWYDIDEFGTDGVLKYVAGKLIRRDYKEMEIFM